MDSDLACARLATPLGDVTAWASPAGLTRLRFGGGDEDRGASEHLAVLAEELRAYFAGRLRAFTVALDLRGTPFQMRVWSELRRVPFGTTISYGQLARRVGEPAAVRAVGAANGRNPVPIVVPCHRVIASDGRLHGYTGGVGIKRALLDLEGAGAELLSGGYRERE